MALLGLSMPARRLRKNMLPLEVSGSLTGSRAGGMFSSTNDLTTIGRSILSSTLIKPAITRRWMKPRGFVSNHFTAVGAPWEIVRLQTSPNNRIVDFYTKSGDLPGYSSQFVLIPDYNCGFSILSAGANPTTNNVLLADLIADTLLPSIETVAREEADLLYAGTYTSPDKSLNSSITISTNTTKPGLGVTSWISNDEFPHHFAGYTPLSYGPDEYFGE
jgi:CubicO group peptidase (beta-lactamase class C family)